MKKTIAVLLIVSISVLFAPYADASNTGDFTINNGRLEKYTGKDTEVVIPNGVTSIGYRAFEGCTAEKIIIPETVTEIGSEAFYRCSFLESITIPSNVTVIGDSAFEKCKSLKSVNITSQVLRYIGVKAFSGCQSLESITIPFGITSISKNTFYECDSLKSITIPESVTTIQSLAFSYCKNLESITLPDSVTTLEDSVFYNNAGLKEITLPRSLTSITPYTFHWCWNLEKINVDASNPKFTSVDGILFSKDKKELIAYPLGKDKEHYRVPDGVTRIGRSAFYYNTDLVRVTLPESLEEIGDEAFMECSFLTDINLPKNLKTIGKYAFAYCSNLSGHIDIPDSVTSVGSAAFYFCYDITGAKLSKRMTTMEEDLFYGCSKLMEITIPYGIRSIEGGALGYCSLLTSVRVPGSVTSIADNAFSMCEKLESVEIPKSVTSIGKNAFSYSPKVTIYTSKGSYAESYAASNGVKYSTGAFKAPNTIKHILINEDIVWLCVGETANLSVTLVPSAAKDKPIVWSSNNPQVLKVDKTGKVTAVGEGEAAIIVKSASDPEVKQGCAIRVLPSPKSVDSLPKLTNDIKNGVRFTNLEKELKSLWDLLNTIYPNSMYVTPYYVSFWFPGYDMQVTMMRDSVKIKCTNEWTPLDKLLMKNVLKVTVQNPQEVYDVYDKYFSGTKYLENPGLVKYVGNVKCYMTNGFICERTDLGKK